jgi:hypothetical protein
MAGAGPVAVDHDLAPEPWRIAKWPELQWHKGYGGPTQPDLVDPLDPGQQVEARAAG